jgi:hypothetical protein
MAGAGPGPSTVAQAAERGDKAEVGGKIVQKTLTAKMRSVTSSLLLSQLCQLTDAFRSREEQEEQWNSRRRRRRRFFRFNMDRDSPDQRKRYAEKNLPVAAFIHGLFGPNDEISRIVLEHALINGNAGHLTFAFGAYMPLENSHTARYTR